MMALVTIDKRELYKKINTKIELSKVFTQDGNMSLPKKEYCDISFLRDIVCDKKQVSLLNLIYVLCLVLAVQ